MKRALFSPAVALLAVGSLNLTPAHAQPARVFVAAQGSDSNPCTFAQPCLSFQHAHDTVAAGGVIDVLSPADYGAVTITKAISIQGHGFAGLAVTSGGGITVNAGASDKVSLRGLLIDGLGSGSTGIGFNTGASLDVQKCLIRNFTANGINFNAATNAPTATSALFVSDTHLAANFNGIRVFAAANWVPTGTFDRVVAVGNGNAGLQFLLRGAATAVANFTVSDSDFSNNGVDGVNVAVQTSSPISVMLRNVVASNNGTHGVVVAGPGPSVNPNVVVWITKSTITGNASSIAGGQITSFGDNSIAGNTFEGVPTNTISRDSGGLSSSAPTDDGRRARCVAANWTMPSGRPSRTVQGRRANRLLTHISAALDAARPRRRGDRIATFFAALRESGSGTSRRFAAVPNFGRDRSKADMRRRSGAGRSY